ncbi:MAG: DUF4012 domain-containing protein [bacterium]
MAINLQTIKDLSKKDKTLLSGAVILVVLFLLVVWDLSQTYQAYKTAINFQPEAVRAAEVLRTKRWVELPAVLKQLSDRLTLVGDKLDNVTLLSALGQVRLGKETLPLFNQLLENSQGLAVALAADNPKDYRGVRLTLGKESDRFTTVLAIIDQIWSSLDEYTGGNAAASLAGLTGLDTDPSLIAAAKPWLKLSPLFVGEEQTRFLVLYADSSTLTAAGGEINSYSVLTLQDGKILDINLRPAKNLIASIPAPELYSKYYNQPSLSLSSSTWSPDFPTIAASWLTKYNQASGDKRPLDGVILVTPRFLQRFMLVTGPLNINGLKYGKEAVTAETSFKASQKSFDFTGKLGVSLIDKLKNSSVGNMLTLAGLASQGFDAREAMIYVAHPRFQQALGDWSGAMRSADKEDYLMVIDSNAKGKFADADISRRLSYQVTADKDKNLIGTTTVSYSYTTAVRPWFKGTYRSVTRIYVPDNSELLEATVNGQKMEAVETVKEYGKQVYGFGFELNPKQTKEFAVKYKLPVGIKDYSLVYQAQPGKAIQSFSASFNALGEKKEWKLDGQSDKTLTLED